VHPATEPATGRSDIATRDRLPSLTGLRFWAALLVVLYHLSRGIGVVQPVTALAWFGRSGVTFFFVLSGFVLAWTYAGSPVRITVFLWRRLARLWPLVAVTGVLFWGAYALVGVHVPLPRALSTFTFLQAWRGAWASGANPASWSLSDEAFFYLLFPAILAVAATRRGRRGLWVLSVLLVPVLFAWAVLSGWLDWRFDYLPLTRVPQFVVGVLCGLAVRNGRWLRIRLGPAVVLVVLYHLALWTVHLAAATAGGHDPAWLYSGSQWWGLPFYALLIVAAAQRDLAATRGGTGSPTRLLTGPWSLRLGHWSYALYLVHAIPVMLWVDWWGAPHGLARVVLVWVVLLAVSVGGAGVLYAFVEHPAERWLRAHGPGGRPAALPAATSAREGS
jgi:peptidoglycan/LPS O-acetylase OafA/YrhL